MLPDFLTVRAVVAGARLLRRRQQLIVVPSGVPVSPPSPKKAVDNPFYKWDIERVR